MRFWRGKALAALAITLLAITAALTVSLMRPAFLQPVRNLVFDSYQTLKPRQAVDSVVSIVEIDERSLQELGQWPWPRTVLADLVEKLGNAGAMAIAFDMVFSEADRTSGRQLVEDIRSRPGSEEIDPSALDKIAAMPDNDTVFANAIARHPVILGFFDAAGQNERNPSAVAGISWIGDDLTEILQTMHGTVTSLSVFQDAATGQGSISLSDNPDDVVRTAPMFFNAGGSVFPALGIEALRVAIEQATGQTQSFLLRTSLAGSEGASARPAVTSARVADFEIPLTEEGSLQIHYAREDTGRYLSAVDVLTASPEELTEKLEGKIVLVGASAAGLRDIRITTLRQSVPGVSIHAQIIDQIMQGDFLSRPDWAQGFEALLAGAVSAVILLLLPFVNAIFSGILALTASGVILLVSWTAFERYGLLIDPTLPLVTTLVAYGMTTVLLFAFSEREKRFIRGAFQQYLAPELINRLEDDPTQLKLGGELRQMTVMFMDIRDFTPISEKLSPEALVKFLNTLLSPLSDCIQRHQGAIDKYIGDSIMAFWNAPLDVDGHEEKACRAALEMLETVEEMNKRDAFGFSDVGLPPVRIGIGISTGECCVGNMGSASRFNYSVVGDTVNIAARLEAATKDAGWPILVGEETAKGATSLALLPAGGLSLKGKSGAVEAFALVGDDAYRGASQFGKLETCHRELLLAVEQGEKSHIKSKLDDCLRVAEPHLFPLIERIGKS